MTRKIYRTAQGKMVDLGRLQLQNENTRAVGNMNVNARGDLIDSRNRPIERRPSTVQKQYNRQTASTAISTPPSAKIKSKASAPVPAPPEDFQENFVKESAAPASSGGLAAAIAKAREIRQDPLRTAQETSQHQEGVKKL